MARHSAASENSAAAPPPEMLAAGRRATAAAAAGRSRSARRSRAICSRARLQLARCCSGMTQLASTTTPYCWARRNRSEPRSACPARCRPPARPLIAAERAHLLLLGRQGAQLSRGFTPCCVIICTHRTVQRVVDAQRRRRWAPRRRRQRCRRAPRRRRRAAAAPPLGDSASLRHRAARRRPRRRHLDGGRLPVLWRARDQRGDRHPRGRGAHRVGPVDVIDVSSVTFLRCAGSGTAVLEAAAAHLIRRSRRRRHLHRRALVGQPPLNRVLDRRPAAAAATTSRRRRDPPPPVVIATTPTATSTSRSPRSTPRR